MISASVTLSPWPVVAPGGGSGSAADCWLLIDLIRDYLTAEKWCIELLTELQEVSSRGPWCSTLLHFRTGETA